ncbi:MAG: endolytic transglycosylase MltG [Deltaproteobacteria bacterium]|nr:endolytic transglycosylase MltG [Candidatus Anaeroferrophillacea bacterium]
MNRRFRLLVPAALTAAALTAAGWLAYDVMRFSHGEITIPPQEFTITPGTPANRIGRDLETAGCITSAWRFRLLLRLQNTAGALQAGTYRFPPRSSPATIIDMLCSGRVAVYQLTVPEGLTLREIAGLVERAGICPAADFAAAAAAPALLERHGITAPNAEGYLFPDTYGYTRADDGAALTERMVNTFNRRFAAATADSSPRAAARSRHELITIAAIIEKETAVPEEKPLVAAVIYNRLDRRMHLACDPTVIYGLGEEFDGNLRRCDLRHPSPYNTYRHRGLPPGPICSPGFAAIAAAVRPAEVDYLYFVARPDGRHHFSATLSEHNRAVRRYQLNP